MEIDIAFVPCPIELNIAIRITETAALINGIEHSLSASTPAIAFSAVSGEKSITMYSGKVWKIISPNVIYPIAISMDFPNAS